MVTVNGDNVASATEPVGGIAWRDHKRYLWLLAIVMPGLTFAAVGLHAATGSSFWLWLGPVVFLGIVLLPLAHFPVSSVAVRGIHPGVLGHCAR